MSQPSRRKDSATQTRRVPGATYRLQFNEAFTFGQATAILDYLAELNITDCYASPLFQAAPGSTHGYDVCSFTRLSPKLGDTDAFERFARQLQQARLGLLLDIVPNHMGADLSNEWWRDVLAQGPASPYAGYFDINWSSGQPDLQNKVLLPILGGHFGEVLAKGELKVVFEDGEISIDYFGKHFPVSPESVALLLAESEGELASSTGKECRETLSTLIQSLKTGATPNEATKLVALKKTLEHLASEHPEFREAMGKTLERYNVAPGNKAIHKLAHLLSRQHYRLAFWRVGPEELNYRRFFDITGLAAMKVEKPRVFDAMHTLVFDLIRKHIVTGLRVDHPDGLWDPKEYFARLQERASALRKQNVKERNPLYVVAEKILSEGESLPTDWPIDGTTGYEFLNLLNGIFVETENAEAMSRIYTQFSARDETFEALVYRCKRKILEHSLVSELNALAQRLKQLAGSAELRRDFTLSQLRTALLEVIAGFPVYRNYITEGTAEPTKAEKNHVERAIATAQRNGGNPDESALHFIRDTLLLRQDGADAEQRKRAREFVMKFQQLTGPVTAKGLEDTAFYIFNRLVSLNEVGGHPGKFGISVETFHQHNAERRLAWPHSLLATATHDTKRGEDVRARINVLSELPEEWNQSVQKWSEMNSAKKTTQNGRAIPDANDEYLLYQTLVGAWPTSGPSPAFTERIAAYLLKAVKEAKENTSWVDSNAAYEDGLKSFIEAVLNDGKFLESFQPFQKKVSFFGRINSLSQSLLKLTSPGVPDIYQGCELWDFSLVDPDNRRSVDYGLRRELLSRIKKEASEGESLSALCARVLSESGCGEAKLFTVFQTLSYRNGHRDLFDSGDYLPLSTNGIKAKHVCAFARRLEDQEIIVAVPRLPATLMQGREELPLNTIWADTMLSSRVLSKAGRYRNLFTGREMTCASSALACAEVFAEFPVALLERIQ